MLTSSLFWFSLYKPFQQLQCGSLNVYKYMGPPPLTPKCHLHITFCGSLWAMVGILRYKGHIKLRSISACQYIRNFIFYFNYFRISILLAKLHVFISRLELLGFHIWVDLVFLFWLVSYSTRFMILFYNIFNFYLFIIF